jgi:hypothetical protein
MTCIQSSKTFLQRIAHIYIYNWQYIYANGKVIFYHSIIQISGVLYPSILAFQLLTTLIFTDIQVVKAMVENVLIKAKRRKTTVTNLCVMRKETSKSQKQVCTDFFVCIECINMKTGLFKFLLPRM